MSGFHGLHTVDLSSNRLTRLSRGLGALMLYHALRHTDLADNPWEMPHPSVCEQVPYPRPARASAAAGPLPPTRHVPGHVAASPFMRLPCALGGLCLLWTRACVQSRPFDEALSPIKFRSAYASFLTSEMEACAKVSG